MEPINDTLWEVAKQRAKFKKQLTSYVLVNAFLWCLWLFSGDNQYRQRHLNNEYFEEHFLNFQLPWPVWVMFFWGIGLVSAYLKAYHGNNVFSAEKEYEKLKNQSK